MVTYTKSCRRTSKNKFDNFHNFQVLNILFSIYIKILKYQNEAKDTEFCAM